MKMAQYLLNKLTSKLGIVSWFNNLSTTPVLECPTEDAFIKRWQLAYEEDITHVIAVPNIIKSKICLFIKELSVCI